MLEELQQKQRDQEAREKRLEKKIKDLMKENEKLIDTVSKKSRRQKKEYNKDEYNYKCTKCGENIKYKVDLEKRTQFWLQQQCPTAIKLHRECCGGIFCTLWNALYSIPYLNNEKYNLKTLFEEDFQQDLSDWIDKGEHNEEMEWMPKSNNFYKLLLWNSHKKNIIQKRYNFDDFLLDMTGTESSDNLTNSFENFNLGKSASNKKYPMEELRAYYGRRMGYIKSILSTMVNEFMTEWVKILKKFVLNKNGDKDFCPYSEGETKGKNNHNKIRNCAIKEFVYEQFRSHKSKILEALEKDRDIIEQQSFVEMWDYAQKRIIQKYFSR